MNENKKIYFPRVNSYWAESRDPALNAYLNMFGYVKADVSEELLAVIVGGELPLIRDGAFHSERLRIEKTISYVMGIYYEEFYHDNERMFLESLIKNLKMRIAVPFVTVRRGESAVPALCCGYDYDAGKLIVIDPEAGEYTELAVDELNPERGQMKFFMLNVPGMIKMQSIESHAMINQAVSMYISRFFRLKSSLVADRIGQDALRHVLDSGVDGSSEERFRQHVRKNREWLTLVRSYDTVIDEVKKSYLSEIEELYQKIAC